MANHIIRRFDINPGDRLYDQGGAVIILSLVLTIKSITATGPALKPPPGMREKRKCGINFTVDAFAPAAIKAEDRGSR